MALIMLVWLLALMGVAAQTIEADVQETFYCSELM